MRFTVEKHGEDVDVLFYDVPCTTDDNGNVTIELTDDEAMKLGLEMERVALSED